MKQLGLFVCLCFNFFTQAQFGYDLVGNSFGVDKITNPICGAVDSCFTLTSDETAQSGAVWDNKPINLLHNFDATFCMTMGSNDQFGADGFAFVLRSLSSATFGESGSGLGYRGIEPSLAIEFDTWWNDEFFVDDLLEDHTGMYINAKYDSPAVSAVPLLPLGENIEDGSYHTARIVWNAQSDSLKMYFDGNLRLAYQGELINSVFGGENLVIWGFTASTGGYTNLQQICFPKYEIQLEDKAICAKDSALINFYDPNITSYRWTNQEGEIIKNWNTIDFTTPFNLNDTLFYTADSGKYYLYVEINNQAVSDSLLLSVFPLPQKPFTPLSLSFCPTTELIELHALNPSCSYEWSSGDSLETVFFSQEGIYSVLLTDTLSNCQNSDTIQLIASCLPTLVVPNIFSPNADSKNDNYHVILNSGLEWIEDFQFQIYNRWGELMYSVSDDLVDWDGTDKNKDVSEGTYFYRFSYRDKEGSELHDGQGTIQLIR